MAFGGVSGNLGITYREDELKRNYYPSYVLFCVYGFIPQLHLV